MKPTLPPLPKRVTNHIKSVLPLVEDRLQFQSRKILPLVDGFDTLIIARIYGYVSAYMGDYCGQERIYLCKPENMAGRKPHTGAMPICKKLVKLTVEHHGIIEGFDLNRLMRPLTVDNHDYHFFDNVKSVIMAKVTTRTAVFLSDANYTKFQAGEEIEGFNRILPKHLKPKRFRSPNGTRANRVKEPKEKQVNENIDRFLNKEAIKLYLAAYPDELVNLNIGSCQYIIARYKAYKTGNHDISEATKAADVKTDRLCRKLGWNEQRFISSERPKYVSTAPLTYNTAV